MAGASNSYSAYDQVEQIFPTEVFLIAIDTNGDTLWTKTVAAPLQHQRAEALSIATNGDLFLTGERWEPGLRDALIMRTTSTGVQIWDRTEDHGRQDLPLDIQALTNGCVVCGTAMSAQGQQVMLIRLDGNGN